MKPLPFPHLLLFLFALLQSFFLLVPSATYDPQVKFFINCGSDSNVAIDGRNFVGDVNSTHRSFSIAAGDAVKDANLSSGSRLYDSARVFQQQSAYKFHIQKHGIFCVRLHFLAFKSGETNLEDAQFDASMSNFSLLSKFSVPIRDANTPVIEEYFLTINQSEFSIEFTPTHRKSFAFVNVIEVFLLPEDFVMDDIISTATNESSPGIRSQVLHTIHRVNIGGPQDQDPLWRNWVIDDNYLISEALAKKCVPHKGELGYGTLGVSPYSASDLVYGTCRELKSSSASESIFSNITWVFEVTKNAQNLVRLHFCNIVSNIPDQPIFNLYIDNFTQLIDTRGYNASFSHLAAPFYFDFVVHSTGLGSLDVSVGSIQKSQVNNAFLNGLEIMEFSKKLDLVSNKEHPGNFVPIIAGSVGGFIVLLLLGGVAVFFRIKRKRKETVSVTELVLSNADRTSERNRSPYMSPVPNLNLNLKISLCEILDATDNFNAKRLIGEGGFGRVYKGTLQNGMKVAVKRSDPQHGQGIPEFETEILVLSKIRHRHLVSLIGYCDELSEMILVYEFMEEGTLRDHLYGAASNLSWNQRLEICIGSARGLHYLHSGADGGIIHRDVKSTNILLDENLVAKVADFGLSVAGPPDPDHFSIGIKGSFGYIDPEYFNTFQFTEKSDVYSFGVVLLEVLCARPAIVSSTPAEEVNLAEWGMHWQAKGQLEKIIDPLLVGKIKAGSLRKFGETVERCLSKNGDDRPSMYNVMWDLEYAVQLQRTGVDREPHEESITDTFSQFGSINIRRLPSIGSSILIEKNQRSGEVASEGHEGFHAEETDVFSQLIKERGR